MQTLNVSIILWFFSFSFLHFSGHIVMVLMEHITTNVAIIWDRLYWNEIQTRNKFNQKTRAHSLHLPFIFFFCFFFLFKVKFYCFVPFFFQFFIPLGIQMMMRMVVFFFSPFFFYFPVYILNMYTIIFLPGKQKTHSVHFSFFD